MIVWQTSDKSVILKDGAVYTGDANPCGYVYIQYFRYEPGNIEKPPVIHAEQSVITKRVGTFCDYEKAADWFLLQDEYKLQQKENHVYTIALLLNPGGNWMCCGQAKKLAGTLTWQYDPDIYYVHYICKLTFDDFGLTHTEINTHSTMDGYTTAIGPVRHTEALTYYIDKLRGRPCSDFDEDYYVVAKLNCNTELYESRIESVPAGQKFYVLEDEIIASGPHDTKEQAEEAQGEYDKNPTKGKCRWYFTVTENKCRPTDDNRTIKRYSNVSALTYIEPSGSTGVIDAGLGKDAATKKRQEYVDATMVCPDVMWYVYLACINDRYVTVVNSEKKSPGSSYSLIGEFDLRSDANALASSFSGRACIPDWTVLLYSNPDRVDCRYEFLPKTSDVSYPYELRDKKNTRSDWAVYQCASSDYTWYTLEYLASVYPTKPSECYMPKSHADPSKKDLYRYLLICACTSGGTKRPYSIKFDPWTPTPNMKASAWFKTYKIYNKNALSLVGFDPSYDDGDGYNTSNYGFTGSCSGSCTYTRTTAAAYLLDTPEDLQ